MKNILFEYGSENITKQLSIGHLKNHITGYALSNIYKELGYNVTSVSYLGDYGLNIALIYEYKGYLLVEIEELYIENTKRYKEDIEYKKEIDKLVADIEYRVKNGGDKQIDYLRNIFVNNYNLEKFDIITSESQQLKDYDKYSDKFIESQGRLIYDNDGSIGVYKNTSGLSTYFARDVLCLIDRLQDKYDKIIYLVGNEQKEHLNNVFSCSKNITNIDKDVEHIGLGLLLDKDGRKMSSRDGTAIKAYEVIGQGEEIIRDTRYEGSMDLSFGKTNIIACGGIYFNILSKHRGRDNKFNMDDALNFNGKSGPYCQYAFCRSYSVLEKTNGFQEVDPDNIHDILEECIKTNTVHKLINHLYDICKEFNKFYENNKIKGNKNNIKITNQFNVNVKYVCRILGIPLLNKM